MGSQQELPSDVIFEILTRTSSLQALDACRAVCKTWNKITYEPTFMPSYCKRTKNVYGYFTQDMKYNSNRSMFVSLDDHDGKNNLKVESLPHDARILASCDHGVVCFERWTKRQNQRYYAYKPTTKQCLALPNPKLRYQEVAVAIMALPSTRDAVPDNYLRYKIMRLSRRGILEPMKQFYKYRCEVFDSKFCKWRELDKDVILPYEEHILSLKPAIFAGISIHWLTSKENVLAFNPKYNCFNKFPIPEPVHNLDSSKKLLEYEGKLGLVYLRPDRCMELWTLEDMETNQWIKKIRLILGNLEDVVLAGFYNSEIAFMKAHRKALFYKLQDCNYKTVDLDDLDDAREIFPFRSDMEPVNLRRSRSAKLEKKKSGSRLPIITCYVLFSCACLFVSYFVSGFQGKS